MEQKMSHNKLLMGVRKCKKNTALGLIRVKIKLLIIFDQVFANSLCIIKNVCINIQYKNIKKLIKKVAQHKQNLICQIKVV